MKKLILKSIMLMLTAAMCLTSCSSDDPIPVIPTATVTLEIPANLENTVLTNAVATLTNVQTKQAYTVEGSFFVKDGNDYKIMLENLEAGTYNIAVNGHLDFTLNGVAGQKDFEVSSENVVLSTTATSMKMTVSTFTAQGGFVISEIFFTGTSSPTAVTSTSSSPTTRTLPCMPTASLSWNRPSSLPPRRTIPPTSCPPTSRYRPAT